MKNMKFVITILLLVGISSGMANGQEMKVNLNFRYSFTAAMTKVSNFISVDRSGYGLGFQLLWPVTKKMDIGFEFGRYKYYSYTYMASNRTIYGPSPPPSQESWSIGGVQVAFVANHSFDGWFVQWGGGGSPITYDKEFKFVWEENDLEIGLVVFVGGGYRFDSGLYFITKIDEVLLGQGFVTMMSISVGYGFEF